MTRQFGEALATAAPLQRAQVTSLVGAVALLTSSASFAAETNLGPQTIDEVTVTAQRRTERLEDVPMAITAISGAELEKAGVKNLHDIGGLAPGVQVHFGGAFSAPSIRGVSTLISGNNIENNVAIYVDGFYEPSAQAINADIPNLRSIEVLKGPQGTLYGRNATGGAILINTLAPSDTFGGKIQLGYGRFDERTASGHLSGPISDRVRASIAGYYRETDGYIKMADPAVIGGTAGDAAPVEQRQVRTKLEVDITDDLTATLGYNYMYVNDPRSNLYSTFVHVPSFLPAPPLRSTQLGVVAYNYKTQVPITTNQGTLKLDWDVGVGKLTSYTGFSDMKSVTDFDFDGTYADLTSSHVVFDSQKVFQQALDFASNPVESLDLIVGATYYTDRLDTGPTGNQFFGPGRVLVQQALGGQDTDAWAVYVDGTYHFADRWSIDLGGRYSSEKKQARYEALGAFASNPAGIPILGPVSNEASWTKFTPSASIRYEIAPRTNVYFSYKQGFRSGAFAFTPPLDTSLWKAVSPESIDSYEIGFKTAGSLIRFDAAAFFYDYTDLQVNQQTRSPLCPPGPCGALLTLLQNAPKAEVYGVEGQLSMTPIDNLTVRAGLSLLHARYVDFPNATGTGLDATLTLNQTQAQNWEGQEMARAPESSGNLGLDYNIPTKAGDLLLSANASFTDSYVINNASLFGNGPDATKQRYRQGGYTLVNASATWTDPSGHYFIEAYGRNLTDKAYRITYSGASFGDYGSPADPLTYGVKVGTSF